MPKYRRLFVILPVLAVHFIPHLLKYLFKNLKPLSRFSMTVLGFGLDDSIAVSSANVAILQFEGIEISPVKMEYRSELRTEPWGTPAGTYTNQTKHYCIELGMISSLENFGQCLLF